MQGLRLGTLPEQAAALLFARRAAACCRRIAPEARERVGCGVHTTVTLSLNAMCVGYTPTVEDASIAEKVAEGVDAELELAMLA